MRKVIIGLGIVLVVLIALFAWGMSGASNDKAPTDVRTLDVTPQP